MKRLLVNNFDIALHTYFSKMKQPEIIYLEEEPDFRVIQKIVGGYFTAIRLPSKKLMYVNEEGELRKSKI